MIVSEATKQNWLRLGTSSGSGRLCKRANKTQSHKLVVPIESIESTANLHPIEEITGYILSSHIGSHCAIYSLALNLLMKSVENRVGLNAFSSQFGQQGTDDKLLSWPLPVDEPDLLGVVYQSITQEGRRNLLGQYYTPRKIVKDFIVDAEPLLTGCLLDPCCGSGNFLCEAKVRNPEQLLGIDVDPIAVMITAANIMLSYPGISFVPHVFCGDFLDQGLFSGIAAWLEPYAKSVSAIYTNPPWGANGNGQESFSEFLRSSLRLLAHDGELRVLLPEAFGKIKAHAGIRREVLSAASITRVVYYPPVFSGVVTPCMALAARKKVAANNRFTLVKDGIQYSVKQDELLAEETATFSGCDETAREILSQISHLGQYTLGNSVWALGIVTGDNKNRVSDTCKGKDWKPVCTGKDVLPYRLKPSSKYVRYVRNELQQVAKENIYNAPEKLVYKFISNHLCFSYDNTNVLFLNSANILLPNIPNMSIKTVLGFLNSDVLKFVYSTKFDDVKILRGNLEQLPFPAITEEDDRFIESAVQSLIDGREAAHEELQNYLYQLFGLSDAQRKHIQKRLYGNIEQNNRKQVK